MGRRYFSVEQRKFLLQSSLFCFSFMTLLLCSVQRVDGKVEDWLIHEITSPVQLKTISSSIIRFENGLIARDFLLTPDFGTIDFRSFSADASIFRAISPEAIVVLDSTRYYIGGLEQNRTFAYLNRTDPQIILNEDAFHFKNYELLNPQAPYPWTPGTRFSPKNVSWPPKGKQLKINFVAPPSAPNAHRSIVISVHYELYQGIPLISKWISVQQTNQNGSPVVISDMIVELLATQPPYSPRNFAPIPTPWAVGPGYTGSHLYVESNQAHGVNVQWNYDDIHWSAGATLPIVNCTYSLGPGFKLYSGSLNFTSFRVLELVTDTYDLERVGLSRHKMTRLLAPQTQENPIFFHSIESEFDRAKHVIDQMAETGFEMFIFSFGSNFTMENTSPSYIQKIKEIVQYGKSKGIEVGGYDLICEARGHGGYGGNVGDQWDTVVPNSNYTLGGDACFASGWEDKITNIIINMVNETGLSMVEMDGPYGGAECAATNHSHHDGLEDSVYWQTRLQGEFFMNLRALNVFINQPDGYFYQGGSKTGMGYDENQYSLPRWQDISVSRQGMFDDTFHYIPTQGWMFVPLVDYHGGGDEAAFEPLSQHLIEYEWALAQYLGFGVAACYRGFEVYDTNATKAVVQKWVSFYKRYRDILISDIVHVRRPDMQGLDAILHVNPFLVNRGLAMVFNPTNFKISQNITLPLYYTGISAIALVREQDDGPKTLYTLERDYSIQISVELQPLSITWYSIQSADSKM